MCSEDTKLLPPLCLWTVDSLRREKQYATKTVYNRSEELLTPTGEIIREWKEYLEDPQIKLTQLS